MRRNALDFREEVAADFCVGSGKVGPRLAGELGGSCGEDDHVGAGKNLYIIRTVDSGHRHKHEPVVQVEHFGDHPGAGRVIKADLLSDSANQCRVSDRGADATGADNADFASTLGRFVVMARPFYFNC